MNPELQSFASAAKAITLTDDEKSSIRSTIFSAAAKLDARRTDTAHPGFFSWLSMLKGVPAMAAFLLLIGVGAGVSYAAENAVPGDWLYPVKINVNEKVAATLAVSAEDQARLQAEQATRRLREAETLAANLRLDAENNAVLQAAFEAHATAVRRNIALLAASQQVAAATDIGSDFEATLQAHAAVMKRLADSRAERRPIVALIQEVEEAQENTERSRVTVEIAMSAIPGDERQASAEKSLVNASSRLEKLRAAIRLSNGGPDDEHGESFDKLKMADSDLNEASAKIDGGAYSDGFMLVRRSMRNAEEARLLNALSRDLAPAVAVETGATGTRASAGAAASAGAITPEQASEPAGDIVQTGRERVKAARELLAKRRAALTDAAINEATLKLEGAEKTLGLAAEFSAKGEAEARDSYVDAALSAVGYVETFIKEPAASSSSRSSAQSAATLIFSPRYKPAKKALEELEGVRDRSRGLLDQQSIDAVSALLVKAQATLVSAQSSYDAGAEADANALFDKVLAQAKEGTAILVKAAQTAITQSSASSASSVRSSSSSSAATTSSASSTSAHASVSSSTQAAVSSSSSKAGVLDPVLSTPLPVPGL
ncbi:MAG TPA: DUF5667 domain-containing protein [Candidatus Peribacteria bacterium]|nr:DUF5667 domain-containing protein [Candidatus Peribacteria bacterium]